MKLSDLRLQKDLKVYRDSAFECFGYINDPNVNKMLTFYDSIKYRSFLNQKIGCIICSGANLNEIEKGNVEGIILSEHPMKTFWELHNLYDVRKQSFSTEIGKNCSISPQSCIAPNNVKIGDNVVIEEFVSIKEHVTIGDNVIIRAGSVIGGTGHYFKRFENNDILSVCHNGGVVISDNTEIQQLCCVHRSIFPWEDTVIGRGCKLGDYVHIGHECSIGEGCFITGKSLICGASTIGERVWIGPGSVIKNGVIIGNDAYVSMGSIIRRNIESEKAFYNEKIMDIEKFHALSRLVY